MTKQKTHMTNENDGLMDSIIALRNDLQHDSSRLIPSFQDTLSEEFARLDPDLMALYKDMKDAHALLIHTQNGGEINATAKWRFESAESAYKTRMMEVRAAKFKMASDQEKNEAMAKREMHENAMQQRMNDQFAALRRKKLAEKQRKSSGGWFYFFILGLWLAQLQHQNRMRLRQEQNMAQSAFNKAHI